MAEATLILGDCLDHLDSFENVSAVLMDPPYGIAHSSSHGASWQDTTIANDDDTFHRDYVIAWAESRRLPWASFGTWKMPRPKKTRGVLVWDKGPAFGMGDLSFPWKPSWEEIYIGGQGWSGERDEGVLRGHLVVSWESKGRCHPHQKPVSLMAKILEKLPKGGVVLDPFMGTGPVGVACVRLGMAYIGIELDPTYFAIAQRRIREAEGVGTLFAPTAEPLTLFDAK